MKKTLIALTTLLLFFTACSQEKKQTQQIQAPPLNVDVITLKKEPVAIWKEYTGTTKASSEQEVRARVSGVLQEIYFKDGQYVKKGQKLFKIQQSEYIAALNAAKAKKKEHEASLKLATADVNRYKPLVKEGLAPRATLEQYQAQQASLKAAILGDAAQIQKAQLQLSYTLISAPISGHVSARRVDVGNLVGQGESTLLTTIVNTDPIYAYFSPSQDDVRLFQKYKSKNNSSAFIEMRSQNETLRLNGFVDFSNNQVDPLTSTITMRATISNKKNEILPGTFVYVNIFVNDKYEFLMIPPEIIFADQQGNYVYTLTQENKIQRTNIETGYATKYYTSVTSGLKDGDRVVVSALVKLKNSMQVNPKDVTQTKGIRAVLEQNDLIPQK